MEYQEQIPFFPTDVFCGIVLGIAVGFAAVKLSDLPARKLKKKEVMKINLVKHIRNND